MAHLRGLLQSSLALVVLFIIPIAAFAQSASITGTVVDPQGNAVVGATITAANVVSGATRTTISSKDGAYQIPQLTPGVYRVRAEVSGFKAIVTENVEALVSTPLTLNFSFKEVGAVNESVTVTGGESILNTSDATIGNTFNEIQIKELPLLSRNVVGLLSLQPGVTKDGNVNGGRTDTANVTLDGVDVNEQQGGQAFFSVLRMTPDSLQEFRVTTTNPNASAGRSSGAQIALITKSGTNQFHGSLYEYHRDTVGTANDWFNNKAGVDRPKLLRNNFGGAIGGPIKKDRIFFFFNYEGFREAKGTSVVRQVPLTTYGAGIIRYKTADGSSDPSCPAGTPSGVACLTRAQISADYLAANGIDPGTNSAVFAILADAAKRYPANDTTVGDGLNTGGYRFNAPNPVIQNTYIARFDAKINEKQNAFLRLNYQKDTSLNGTPFFPDTPAPTIWSHPEGLALNHSWAISNSLVNNFTYGLTREAFTNGGDSDQNSIVFRFIFQPVNFSRGQSRATPAHNFVDDLSWAKGNHAMQYGGNVRLISNSRDTFGTSYDSASFNPSGYDASGAVVYTSDAGASIFPNVAAGSQIPLRDALTTAIGRYTQYTASVNYNLDGSIIPTGTGIARLFKTQEYEAYGQDSWRIRQNLTLTYGLRWSTSTPVYEANGLEVAPTVPLGDYFDQRVAGAKAGVPYNAPVTLDLAGKANGRPGYYPQDWNNFAPSAALAWSPNSKNLYMKRLFGENKSTIRVGFRMIYDRIGSALAVAFDQLNSLGFSSASTVAVNTYNVSDRLGPLFTGYGQDIRTLPLLDINPSLKFPLQKPTDGSERIEQSLDSKLTTPVHYNFNFSYARDLGKGYSLEVSYVGRLARKLLTSYDVMQFNDLTDPKSGMDFYTAMRQLIALRDRSAPIASVQQIPYFQNLFPGLANGGLTATQGAYRRVAFTSVGGLNTADWTFIQTKWNNTPIAFTDDAFVQPQYAAFAAYGTIGSSDYHSAQVSFRKRFSKDLSFDFNYTFSHSLDTSSGAESSGSLYGASFILNPFDLSVDRGNSNFDIRHQINANYIWALPVGKGKKFFGGLGRVTNAIFGGWEMTGIFRYNSGLPAGAPFDSGRWATNWEISSNGVAIRPIQASPTRTGDPNIFSDPTNAYQSYRTPYPGEFGDRNTIRYPGFVGLDAGLYKAFNLPGEGHRLIIRWEVYNITNTQPFTGISNFGLDQNPNLGLTPPPDFGKFTSIQGSPRQQQIALRIEF
ncbi:MAG: TonB-dependent receptor [Chloracidobacterium sp.]|nr:TonB-dependent receptor [Chloracidobacterium sp.]